MKFTKMQGAGNDFVVIKPEKTEHDWPVLAKKMCDRRFGIGADGVILALPSKVANLRMRIFNPDGSEAEMCGNGLRCLAKYAVLNRLVKPLAPKITIETIPGIRTIKLGYEKGELSRIQVAIGIPRFSPEEIPVIVGPESGRAPVMDYPLTVNGQPLSLSFVSMGNPHAVFFTDRSTKDFPLKEIGPHVENHIIFPQRVNFEVVNVLSRDKIEMRVWERGAGETLACGSGACAVAVAANLHKYVDNKVEVKLPGGVLFIEWDGAGEVLMSGPAEVVFTGDWPQNID
jgi:diaminopimelate epimerase